MPAKIISYRFNSDVSSRLAFSYYGFPKFVRFVTKANLKLKK
nr:MAG TPA: hypothetical protein [Caudoviricetes sp.]